ncbi:hypothetical protein, partial [Prevotella sp. 885]|uniref:hypothetical protein n=1 Tax=Prevotella sp. 885 TaxID=2022527 RepID=UPI001C3E8600
PSIYKFPIFPIEYMETAPFVDKMSYERMTYRPYWSKTKKYRLKRARSYKGSLPNSKKPRRNDN